MARRPSRGSSAPRGGNRGGSRGRSGGGSNNSAMYIGLGVVVIIAVAALAFMGGKDEEPDGPSTIAGKETAKKAAPRESTDDLWKKNGKEPAKVESNGDKRWGAKWKDDFDKSDFKGSMTKVDRTIWNEVEELFAEARKLKVQALDARKAGNEDEFAKLMGKAVRTWREGDLRSELFAESVELIQEDMWDAMFKTEQKKLESLTKEFRGYLMYENKK